MQPIAPASVGVNQPVIMPPTMMTGDSKARKASFVAFRISFPDCLGLLGRFIFRALIPATIIREIPIKMPGM